MKRACCMLLFLALTAAITAPVHAQDYYSYGFPWFGYGNNGPAAYALGNIPTPPYFALHPPVYYSHPIARPYGHSPFACPNLCHGEMRRTESRVVVNPYIEVVPPAAPAAEPAEETPAKTTSNVAAVPTRVTNPYYQRRGLASN